MDSEVLFILMSRWLVYSSGSGVNRVQVVLSGFRVRLLCFVQTKPDVGTILELLYGYLLLPHSSTVHFLQVEVYSENCRLCHNNWICTNTDWSFCECGIGSNTFFSHMYPMLGEAKMRAGFIHFSIVCC